MGIAELRRSVDNTSDEPRQLLRKDGGHFDNKILCELNLLDFPSVQKFLVPEKPPAGLFRFWNARIASGSRKPDLQESSARYFI